MTLLLLLSGSSAFAAPTTPVGSVEPTYKATGQVEPVAGATEGE